MQQRKLRVGIARFPYGGNGGTSQETPDVADWLINASAFCARDPRIEELLIVRFSDTPITMTRNQAVLWAIEKDVDVLVMVDSDMSPDIMLGVTAKAKPWLPTSFDFLYERWEQKHSIIVAPYCGPPSHPTRGGFENPYVFRWTNFNSGHTEWPVKLEPYSRAEAAIMTGMGNIDSGPTGLSMYDVRIFKKLTRPWFEYEWDGENEQCPHCKQRIPGARAAKATTEDCFFFRNVTLHFVMTEGYNPVFCNWDAWAGHWKPWCVGAPQIVTAEQVGMHLKEAAASNVSCKTSVKAIGSPLNLESNRRFDDDLFYGSKRDANARETMAQFLEEAIREDSASHEGPTLILEIGDGRGNLTREIVAAIPHGMICHIIVLTTDESQEARAEFEKNTAMIRSTRILECRLPLHDSKLRIAVASADVIVVDFSGERAFDETRDFIRYAARDTTILAYHSPAGIDGFVADCKLNLVKTANGVVVLKTTKDAQRVEMDMEEDSANDQFAPQFDRARLAEKLAALPEHEMPGWEENGDAQAK